MRVAGIEFIPCHQDVTGGARVDDGVSFRLKTDILCIADIDGIFIMMIALDREIRQVGPEISQVDQVAYIGAKGGILLFRFHLEAVRREPRLAEHLPEAFRAHPAVQAAAARSLA